MKKRFLFDLVALLAIAVGFLMILYFQDLDVGFLLGSEYAENENQDSLNYYTFYFLMEKYASSHS